jgi:hypothetical protein
MNVRHLVSLSGALGLLVLASASGCSNDESTGNESTAEVEMAFSGVDFSYNSVRIIATRSTPADSKYPCDNYADVCFDFDADGHPINPYTYKNGFKDLCPYEDIDNYGNPGTWTFDYYIYTKPGCDQGYGTLLNTPNNDNNFVCFDSTDIFEQQYMNQSVGEVLYAGQKKKNTIFCISANADKKFDFNSCAIIENDPGYKVKLDCGCYPDYYGGCNCDQFDTLAGLPAECSVDPAHDCNVVCKEPPYYP